MKFKSIFLFRKMKENLIGRNENCISLLYYYALRLYLVTSVTTF